MVPVIQVLVPVASFNELNMKCCCSHVLDIVENEGVEKLTFGTFGYAC